MKEIVKYSGCFVCGDRNDVGLDARFFNDGGRAVCDIATDEKYAGYKNIFHGGITSTLLDEVMIGSLLAQNLVVVTAELRVRFRKPVYCGDRLHLEGWQVDRRDPLLLTAGRAVNQNGDIVAEASGKYVMPDSSPAVHLHESLEQ